MMIDGQPVVPTSGLKSLKRQESAMELFGAKHRREQALARHRENSVTKAKILAVFNGMKLDMAKEFDKLIGDVEKTLKSLHWTTNTLVKDSISFLTEIINGNMYPSYLWNIGYDNPEDFGKTADDEDLLWEDIDGKIDALANIVDKDMNAISKKWPIFDWQVNAIDDSVYIAIATNSGATDWFLKQATAFDSFMYVYSPYTNANIVIESSAVTDIAKGTLCTALGGMYAVLGVITGLHPISGPIVGCILALCGIANIKHGNGKIEDARNRRYIKDHMTLEEKESLQLFQDKYMTAMEIEAKDLTSIFTKYAAEMEGLQIIPFDAKNIKSSAPEDHFFCPAVKIEDISGGGKYEHYNNIVNGLDKQSKFAADIKSLQTDITRRYKGILSVSYVPADKYQTMLVGINFEWTNGDGMILPYLK